MPDREPRDVLGEALRNDYGPERPRWRDVPENIREQWRRDADGYFARLAEAGYRIVGGKDG